MQLIFSLYNFLNMTLSTQNGWDFKWPYQEIVWTHGNDNKLKIIKYENNKLTFKDENAKFDQCKEIIFEFKYNKELPEKIEDLEKLDEFKQFEVEKIRVTFINCESKEQTYTLDENKQFFLVKGNEKSLTITAQDRDKVTEEQSETITAWIIDNLRWIIFWVIFILNHAK